MTFYPTSVLTASVLSGTTVSGLPAGSGSALTGISGTAAQWSALPAGFTPANPATTASTTLVMMGLGTTVTFTPRSSGVLLVSFDCSVATATAVAVITVGPRFGTGAAPANGVAVTGTRFGVIADITTQAPSTTAPDSVGASAVLTGLATGVAVWFDLALATAVGADVATMTNVSFSVVEL